MDVSSASRFCFSLVHTLNTQSFCWFRRTRSVSALHSALYTFSCIKSLFPRLSSQSRLHSRRLTFFQRFLSIMYRVSEGVITPGCADCQKFQMNSRETERRRKKATKLVCQTIASIEEYFSLHVGFFFNIYIYLTGKVFFPSLGKV